jgi:N-acetylglutamate synthase-like GNAT family acetyltransferase
MHKFSVSLSSNDICDQIAQMLNTYNNLSVVHNSYTINTNGVSYIIELNMGKVIGCVGMINEYHDCTLIKHMCVNSKFRRLGIATKLLTTCINKISTNTIHMYIREDNKSSLSIANKLGFTCTARLILSDRILLTMTKYKSQYQGYITK